MLASSVQQHSSSAFFGVAGHVQVTSQTCDGGVNGHGHACPITRSGSYWKRPAPCHERMILSSVKASSRAAF